MKKALCLLFCLIVALSFASCSFPNPFDDRADKEDIFAFVKENEDSLVACINNNDFSEIKGKTHMIHRIDTDDIKFGFVDFDCGGSGFGSETSYCGFYFSDDDNMTEIWCAPSGVSLSKSGSGYEWHEENGDNTYYTENICGHFYYYEASY